MTPTEFNLRTQLLAAQAECKELKQSLAWESKRVDELHMAQAEDSQTIASLRATLATIQTEAEAMPVPGGFTYAISGQLMGMIDKVLK